MNICVRNKGLIIGNIRNRGNKELSKQSNCFVLQGTKVSSAEEHNQRLNSPESKSAVSTLFSKQGYQISRKLSIPQ